MATKGKEIKLRLQSIKNTKKITKTMEMVSAVKMRRSVQSTMKSRPYHALTLDVLQRITRSIHRVSELHPTAQRFFQEPPQGAHTTLVVITSNRGLCGALNVNIARTVMNELELRENQSTDVICIGKKGVQLLSSFGVNVSLAYDKNDTAVTDASILDLSDLLYKKFLEQQTDHVAIVYPHFQSAIKQEPVIRMLYPFPTFLPTKSNNENDMNGNSEHLYEPNAVDVLEYLIPRYGEIILYQELLESNASEHSARMVSMKNATDAAKEMVDELTLEFNKARQASITKEIAEIASGAAALAQSSF